MYAKTLLSGLCWLGLLAGNLFAQAVEIQFLNPTISTTRELVRLQDVAKLSGGDPGIRHKLAQLDLETFQSEQTKIEIPSEQVRCRILMAGISDSNFQIEPATSTQVFYWQPEKINQLIQQSIYWQFVETYRVPEEEFELDVISQLDSALVREGIELNSLSLIADLPTELPIGQRTVPITITDAQGKSLKLNAICRFTIYRQVAMVRTRVAKGEVLNEQNVESVRRPINHGSVQLASYEEAIGKTAYADLRPYSVVNQHSLRTPTTATSAANPTATGVNPASPSAPVGPVVIRARTPVNIVLRQGGLEVTLRNAIARENGRVGESIQFMNPMSKKTIYATVIDAQTATIQR